MKGEHFMCFRIIIFVIITSCTEYNRDLRISKKVKTTDSKNLDLTIEACFPKKDIVHLPRITRFEHHNIFKDLGADQTLLNDIDSLPALSSLFGFEQAAPDKVSADEIKHRFDIAAEMARQVYTLAYTSCDFDNARENTEKIWNECVSSHLGSYAKKVLRRALNKDERDRLKIVYDSNILKNRELDPENGIPKSDDIDGYLDSITSGIARGWVYDKGQPSRHPFVRVYGFVDGRWELAGQGFAREPRPDVNMVMGYDGDRGYEFPVFLAKKYEGIQIKFKAVSEGANTDVELFKNNDNDIFQYQPPVSGAESEFPILTFENRVRFAIEAVYQALFMAAETVFKVEDALITDVSELEKSYAVAAKIAMSILGSYPDEKLLKEAENKGFDEAIVKAHTIRLIESDPDRLSRNFAGQWLGFQRNLENTDPLKQSMGKESLMLFSDVFSSGKDFKTLLNPGYTYVNNKLDQIYGLSSESLGNDFVKVKAEYRGSPLFQGSVLTEGHVDRETSIVRRGVFLLSAILCRELPVLGAATLEEIAEVAQNIPKDATALEKANLHRGAAANCVACHQHIDPLGLGLERYDGFGNKRGRYPNGKDIQLGLALNEVKIENEADLLRAVSKDREFTQCVQKRMVSFISFNSPQDKKACNQYLETKVNDDPESIRGNLVQIIIDYLKKRQLL